ncbi:nitrogen fixation protein NifX [Paraburkholderia diazotrophica]|uniref:Nitrogen fixation protein NifX n=1 Tax=Paraburkholderia diazotrophica TaxID=667676 RepID=A0A1H7EBE9_9BURK|nr:nitrogen fixation protein NifX [Paraburkholderia diazotrophica]SEK09402.1 nitrogen fixation protein NifX [Paraburkholderia diazotrophica]
MKIAFATQDKVHVDAHFGSAKNIVTYDVTADSHTFVEAFYFGDNLVEDGDEDKLTQKLEVIQGCAILYVAAIGGSGAARVVALKVHPVKVSQPESIEDILIKLRVVLKGSPPPWLRKALTKNAGRSYDIAEDDEIFDR